MITFYHQTKTSISFCCKRGLNPRSLIQPSKTLPVELSENHFIIIHLKKIQNKTSSTISGH